MTNIIEEILQKKLVLTELASQDFYIGFYHEYEIRVRLNDFPEEVMYTIFYKGESLDLDDLPEEWEIEYL